ncbi:hypothetical protein UP17_08425 [Peribacillus simplex]|nr:hypothetical protein UP17_08425 [Peribacillus simplex]
MDLYDWGFDVIIAIIFLLMSKNKKITILVLVLTFSVSAILHRDIVVGATFFILFIIDMYRQKKK